MAFVVDSSVTMAWCFEDEVSPAAEQVLDRLGAEPAIAPFLWQLEVANVLLVAERRGRITQAQVARFVELLAQLPIRVDVESIDTTTLLAVGRQHGLSAYDACYLVLAQRLGVPLASLDRDLVAAGRAAGVAMLTD